MNTLQDTNISFDKRNFPFINTWFQAIKTTLYKQKIWDFLQATYHFTNRKIQDFSTNKTLMNSLTLC